MREGHLPSPGDEATPPRRPAGQLAASALPAALIALAWALPPLIGPRLWPALVPHIPGPDTETALRVVELTTALRGGHWPPRWMPDALMGLGYPFWIFHGPLPYLQAAALRLGGADVLSAIRVCLAALLAASSLSAHAMVRRLGPDKDWSRAVGALWPVPFVVAAALLGPGHILSLLTLALLLPLGVIWAGRVARGGGLEAALGWAVLVALALAAEPRPDRPWLSVAMLLAGLALAARQAAVPPAPAATTIDIELPPPTAGPRGPGAIRSALARRELDRWRRGGPPLPPLGWSVAGGLLGLALSAWLWLPARLELGELGEPTNDALVGGELGRPDSLDFTRADLATFESLTARLATLEEAPLPSAVAEPPRGTVDLAYGHEGYPRPLSGVSRVERATLGRQGPAHQEWRLTLSGGQPSDLAFPTLWFPGWQARVNGGRPRAAGAVEGSGWIQVRLEAGECEPSCSIVLALARSPARAMAEALSLLALLILISLALLERRRWSGRSLLPAMVVLAGLALLARFLPDLGLAAPGGGLEVWIPTNISGLYSDHGRAWPVTLPDGLPFGSSGDPRPAILHEARLVGSPNGTDAAGFLPGSSDPEVDAPAPRRREPMTLLDAGDSLEVRMRWSPAAEGDEVAAQLVPADPWAAEWQIPLAKSKGTIEAGGQLVLNLDVPPLTAPGLYLVFLLHDDDSDSGPSTSTLGWALLGPLRVRRISDRLPADEGHLAQLGDIALVAIEAGEPVSTRLPVRIRWRAGRALAVDHAFSLHLEDNDGKTVGGSISGQPFDGLFPTSAWPAGEVVEDLVELELVDSKDLRTDRYHLVVELIDALTKESLGGASSADLDRDQVVMPDED